MKLMDHKKTLSLPAIMAIAATRGMMGFGAGLLVSNRMDRKKRTKVGWVLFGVGAATTVPLAAYVRQQ